MTKAKLIWFLSLALLFLPQVAGCPRGLSRLADGISSVAGWLIDLVAEILGRSSYQQELDEAAEQYGAIQVEAAVRQVIALERKELAQPQRCCPYGARPTVVDVVTPARLLTLDRAELWLWRRGLKP